MQQNVGDAALRVVVINTGEAPPKEFYIKRRDVELHGVTKGCAGCRTMFGGGTRQNHSAECRERFRALLQGEQRVQRMEAKRKEFADKAAEEEQRRSDKKQKKEAKKAGRKRAAEDDNLDADERLARSQAEGGEGGVQLAPCRRPGSSGDGGDADEGTDNMDGDMGENTNSGGGDNGMNDGMGNGMSNGGADNGTNDGMGIGTNSGTDGGGSRSPAGSGMDVEAVSSKRIDVDAVNSKRIDVEAVNSNRTPPDEFGAEAKSTIGAKFAGKGSMKAMKGGQVLSEGSLVQIVADTTELKKSEMTEVLSSPVDVGVYGGSIGAVLRGNAYWDDVRGGWLDQARVREARLEELSFMRKEHLWDVVPRSRAEGQRVVSVR